MTTKPLIITHGKCDDGFAAACVLRQVYGDAADYIEGHFQDPPPDCTGRHVIMADFSYKRPIMEKIRDQSVVFDWYDHHKSAIEDMAGFQWRATDTHIEDISRSGAGIVADAYGKRTKFINYIEDRDLWRFWLPHTMTFSLALRSYDQTFEIWSDLMENSEDEAWWNDFIAEGRIIECYYNKIVRDLCKQAYQAWDIPGNVWVVNCPRAFASDVAHKLAQEKQCVAATWYTDGNQNHWSIRSVEGGPDVSLIAGLYGGGGHKHAAGFRTPTDVIG